MSKKPPYPVSPSTLGKDFAVFRDPGFLIALGILLLMLALALGVLFYGTSTHGIPPMRF